LYSVVPKSHLIKQTSKLLPLLLIALLFNLDANSLAAEHAAKPEPKPAVLSPDNFVGKASLGYAAAKEIPEVCSKLFCYCGCDMTDSHSSLLDCFTCEHGVDCTICQDEAIIALDLKKKGLTLAAIQKEIDDAFQNQYPWQEKPSPALEKYRGSVKETPVNPKESAKLSKTESFLNLKAQPGVPAKGHRSGACCGHNHS
jgi:hypothetical protein